MREHISAPKLEQFIKGDFPVKEIVEISKHIAQCFGCKEELHKISPNFLDETFEKVGENERHFSDVEILRFAKGDASLKYRLAMADHFRNCSACKTKLYNQDPVILQQTISTYLNEEDSPKKKSLLGGLKLLVPITAMAAILFGFVYFAFLNEKNGTAPVLVKDRAVTLENIPPNIDREKIQNSKTSVIDKNNSAKTQAEKSNSNEVKRKTNTNKKKVVSRKANPKVSRSKIVTSTSRSAKSPSRIGAGEKIIPISPRARTRTDSQPLFRWKSVPNAVKYDIYISDISQILIEKGTTKSETTYKLKAKLKSGKSYRWKVIATTSDEKTVVGKSIDFSVKSSK